MTRARVVGIFGPTASGKSAVAAAARRAGPRGGRLRGRDAGLRRRSDPHEPVATGAARRDLAARRTRRRSASTRALAHEAIDAIARRRPDAGRRRRHRPLLPRRARRARTSARAADPELRARVAAGLRRARRRGSARTSRRARPARRRTRPRERSPARRPCARARRARALARARQTTASGRRARAIRPCSSVSTSRRRARCAHRRAHAARCSRAGVEAEVAAAPCAEPMSLDGAPRSSAFDEVAELPRDEAIAAIAQRTRRYAAYQRKWMRRIPGLVPLDGTRSPDELAAAIAARLSAERGE